MPQTLQPILHLTSHFHGIYSPQKYHFWLFRKASTAKAMCSVLSCSPCANPNQSCLGEGESVRRSVGQSRWEKRAKKKKKILNLILPWRFIESFLYITALSTIGLSSCLFEPYRQSWGWGGFVVPSCAISSIWQVQSPPTTCSVCFSRYWRDACSHISWHALRNSV